MGFVPFNGSAKSAAEAKTTTPSGSLPDVTLTNVSTMILGMEAGTFILLVLVFFISTCCLACWLVYCMSAMFATKSSVLARGKKILQKSLKLNCKNQNNWKNFVLREENMISQPKVLIKILLQNYIKVLR